MTAPMPGKLSLLTLLCPAILKIKVPNFRSSAIEEPFCYEEFESLKKSCF